MPPPPDADFVVLTSRLAPHRDGGYAVAVASRVRLLHSIGVTRPLLLTVDVGDADEHAKDNLLAFPEEHPNVEIRNLFDEIREDSSWLYDDAREGTRDPDISYRAIHDAAGHEVVSLPVIRDDAAWYLTEAPVVVRGSGEPRTLAGFRELYLAWLTRVAAQLRARAGDDSRRIVVICESKQLGELIADWTDPDVRIVHTVHNAHLTVPCEPSSPLRDEGWRRWLTLRDRFDAVIWPTASQMDDVTARFGADEGSVAIPTPVLPGPRPDPDRRRTRDVLMVNRLAEQKRVDLAIAAWPRVLEKVPDARLNIYGDGPLRAQLQQLIDDLGLARSVRLHGHSDEVREAMATAAAFLCTSAYEGQNLAIGEALASGLPVVAFDVCYGPRDYVGEGGTLVTPGDADGVADALSILLTDEEARTAMSERARVQSVRLSPDAVGQAFCRLLDDVVARPARRVAA